jgi:hypothetical protein
MKNIKTKPDVGPLLAAGWKKVYSFSPWCWQEPKTFALYKVQDALDLVASQTKEAAEIKRKHLNRVMGARIAGTT